MIVSKRLGCSEHPILCSLEQQELFMIQCNYSVTQLYNNQFKYQNEQICKVRSCFFTFLINLRISNCLMFQLSKSEPQCRFQVSNPCLQCHSEEAQLPAAMSAMPSIRDSFQFYILSLVRKEGELESPSPSNSHFLVQSIDKIDLRSILMKVEQNSESLLIYQGTGLQANFSLRWSFWKCC